jgi:outer membrane protein assembly factor BamD (BamD/ComL family)
MKRLVFSALVLLLLSPPVLAQRPTLEIYSEAIRTSQQGDPEQAVQMLWEVVREDGDNPLADDALFQIGHISEKEIGDYDGAEKAYSLLMDRYPHSKSALRAKQRLAGLRAARETGDEPLKRLNEIQGGYAQMGGEEALARLKDLYNRYPDFNRRDQVLFMIAEEAYRQKSYDEALGHYQDLVREFPESERIYYALVKIGKTHVERRDFDAATQAFERVSEYEKLHYEAGRQSGQEEIQRVLRFQRLRTLFLLSLAVAAAALIVWLTGTRWKTLQKSDLTGAAVLVIVLSALFLVALHLISARPWIYQATLIYTWIAVTAAAVLNHFFVGSRTLGGTKKVLATAGAFLAASAIVYAVYYQQDMVNLLYDSIQYSMEKGEW